MDYQIGSYDSSTRTVPVSFTHEGVTYTRNVNAVLDASSAYDIETTTARVADVARGVAYKIEQGIITNPPPEETAPSASPDSSSAAAASPPDAPAPASSSAS